MLEGQKWASNTTTVDIYVRREKVDEVKESLLNASMDFRIMLDDVQNAIDQENPPVPESDYDESMLRKGKQRYRLWNPPNLD